MLSKQYQLMIQMARVDWSVESTCERIVNQTYQLELNGHQTEIDNLHQRPNHEVGFQGWDIHISQLVGNSSSSASFSNGHDGKEASNA